MKRLMLLLAMGVILVVSLTSVALSRVEPFNLQKPYVDPDDHTWGGDQPAGVSDRGINQPGKPYVGWFSSITTWDVFINNLFGNWWWLLKTDAGSAAPTRSSAAGVRSHSEESNLEVPSNNKGN